MTLADALGIVSWVKTDSLTANAYEQAPTIIADERECWCFADDLDVFWGDTLDARWLLLIAILKSIGYSEESIMPLDEISDLVTGHVISFGKEAHGAINLPSLDSMLIDGQAKKQAWQVLCAHKALFVS